MFAKLSGVMLALALVASASIARTAGAADPPAADNAHAASGEAHGDHAHSHIGTANSGKNLEKPEEFKSDLALFTLVVFLLLLAILWKFAWGPIIAALEKREEKIADDIAQAERNHEESKRLLADYERKLAAAAGEVREMMEEARRDAEQVKQGIMAEAKAGAETERARSLRDIEAATDQAMETLAKRSAQLAVDLAGKILQSKLSSDDHAKLIQEAMAKFPSVDGECQLKRDLVIMLDRSQRPTDD